MSDIQNYRLEIIKDRINQYGIRFPVAAIKKATGLNKGYISAVLNGAKPVSDNFWQTFDEKFPNKNGEGDAMGKQKITLELSTILDLLHAAQQEKKRLLDVIDVNLTTLVSTQQVILGHVKAGHKWEAKKHGKGSAQKEAAILEQLNKFADEYTPGGEVVDKRPQKDK